jgi:hypothetical protein
MLHKPQGAAAAAAQQACASFCVCTSQPALTWPMLCAAIIIMERQKRRLHRLQWDTDTRCTAKQVCTARADHVAEGGMARLQSWPHIIPFTLQSIPCGSWKSEVCSISPQTNCHKHNWRYMVLSATEEQLAEPRGTSKARTQSTRQLQRKLYLHFAI